MTMAALRVVFLTGTNKAVLLRSLLQDGEQIVAVLLPFATKRENRLVSVLEHARDAGIPVLRPKRSDLTQTLRDLSPDILLSAGYPYLLTADQLRVARLNVNVHPTLLPKYRGRATAWHVIAHGERESGVTVHFIDEDADTGPILCQSHVPLTSFDTPASLMRKTDAVEPETVREALRLLRQGRIVGVLQNERVASCFTEIRTPEDSRIDPSMQLSKLYDFIRACDPDRFPAFFEVDGQRVGIRLFRVQKPPGEEDMI